MLVLWWREREKREKRIDGRERERERVCEKEEGNLGGIMVLLYYSGVATSSNKLVVKIIIINYYGGNELGNLMLLCKLLFIGLTLSIIFHFFFWLCNDVWEGWVCACVRGSMEGGDNA